MYTAINDTGFAVFVSFDYCDCFRAEILVDKLNKHNFRMYFWNVSATVTYYRYIFFSEECKIDLLNDFR